MALMNKRQYGIVKCIAAMRAPLPKFAKMINVDLLELQRVAVSSSYEQYAQDDRPDEDVLGQFMELFGMGRAK